MINLTKNQLTCMMISIILIRLYLTLPREILIYAGNAGWILILYLIIIAFFLFFIVSHIYKKNESPLDIAEKTGGKIFKIITGLSAVIIILIKASGHIKLFIESIQMILLQNTPTEIIVMLLAVTLIIGAHSGIESLSIISSLFLPVVLTVLAAFLFLLIPNIDIKNLTPILGNGANKIFIESLHLLSLFGDLFLLYFLLPYCKEKKVLSKIGYKSILINGIIFIVFMLAYTSVFPYPVSSEYIIPIFQLTRIVKIGDFFGRFEAFFEFIWAISFFIYAAINIWILSIIWQKTFNLKYHEPLIAPMTVFSIGIGFLQPNLLKIINGNKYFSWTIISFAFLLPIIYGFLSNITQKDDI